MGQTLAETRGDDTTLSHVRRNDISFSLSHKWNEWSVQTICSTWVLPPVNQMALSVQTLLEMLASFIEEWHRGVWLDLAPIFMTGIWLWTTAQVHCGAGGRRLAFSAGYCTLHVGCIFQGQIRALMVSPEKFVCPLCFARTGTILTSHVHWRSKVFEGSLFCSTKLNLFV